MAIESELLRAANVPHGFGSAIEPLPEQFASAWDTVRPRWRQVHGVGVCEVTRQTQECGEVDALFTFQKGIPLGIVTADCVPILLAHRQRPAIAVVHAGWRGTLAGILGSLSHALENHGLPLGRDWIAALGPSIGACCYEVSPELGERFLKSYKRFEPGVLQGRMLNLRHILAKELVAQGLFEVDVSSYCTHCSRNSSNSPLFHSFRRDGTPQRQYSIAQIP